MLDYKRNRRLRFLMLMGYYLVRQQLGHDDGYELWQELGKTVRGVIFIDGKRSLNVASYITILVLNIAYLCH